MLIFRQHPELMKRLDLHNEYELHAVLKKKKTNRSGTEISNVTLLSRKVRFFFSGMQLISGSLFL